MTGYIDCTCRVSGTATVHVRGEEGIDPQFVEEFFVSVRSCFDADVHQHDAMMRVADDLFDQLVALFLVLHGVADSESLWMDVLEGWDQVALFFVDKAFAVTDKKTEIAGLRVIDGGVIDLVEDAVRNGEPDPA